MKKVDEQEKGHEDPESSYGGHDLEGWSAFGLTPLCIGISGRKETTNTNSCTNTLGESERESIARHAGLHR